jgi:hypothetical protein
MKSWRKGHSFGNGQELCGQKHTVKWYCKKGCSFKFYQGMIGIGRQLAAPLKLEQETGKIF